MSAQPLDALSADLDRLLSAGAGPDGAAKLRQHAVTLAKLAAKVPALFPLAEAARRAADASPADAPAALLDLLTKARQARTGLASAGMPGSLEELSPSGPWATAAAADLASFVRFLTSHSNPEPLAELFTRAGADLRLFAPLLAALSAKRGVADWAADVALPAFGPAASAALQGGIDVRGDEAGTRRLRALCKADRASGLEVCRRAVREGSDKVRVQALACLPDVADAAEAEAAGLQWCEGGNKAVRGAALAALRTATSEAALAALIARLGDDERSVRDSAVEALVGRPDPGTSQALLAALKVVLRERTSPPVLPPSKRKRTPAAERKAMDRLRYEQIHRANGLMEAVGRRKDGDPEAIRAALLPVACLDNCWLAPAATWALVRRGDSSPEAIRAYAAALSQGTTTVTDAAIAGLDRAGPQLREPVVPVLCAELKSERHNGNSRRMMMELLPAHMDRFGGMIVESLHACLRNPADYVRNDAARVLGRIGPAALAALPGLLDHLRSEHARPEAAFAASRIDPEGTTVIPVLIELLATRNAQVAAHGLANYGPKAAAAIPALKEALKSANHWVAHSIERALASIRGRPSPIG